MKKYLFFIAVIISIFGCQPSAESDKSASSESAVMADEMATADTTVISKIIKTADMRFRVKDVQQTKEQLAAAIKAEGGMLAEFNIQSVVQESDKVKFSLDSLKEITSYRKEGVVVAKVPSEKLDEFTNVAARLAIFVDAQSMKMDDQGIAYLSNQMKLRNREKALRSVDKHSSKKVSTVKTGLAVGDDYVEKKIENIETDQKVRFSTITFSFYQANTVQSTIVSNDNLRDYGPGFFKRVGLNIASGWSFLKEIILGMLSVWPLLLLALLMYFGFRYLSNRRKPVVLPQER